MGLFMDGFKKIPKMKTGGSVRKYEEGGEVKSGRYQVWDESKMQPLSKEYKTAKGAQKIAETTGGSVKEMGTWQPKYDYSKTGAGEDTGNYRRSSVGGSGGGGADLPKGMIPGGPKNRNYKTGGPVGLYANIHKKRERIAAGSGEKMRKPGSPGAPTAKAFKESAKTAKK